jgi:hypothetical protein
MTMRAPERRDLVAVVSAQPVLGRRLLRQCAGFAIIDFMRPTWAAAAASRVRREVGRD